MKKLRGFDMTDSRDTFLKGATAFMNAKDLARNHRDIFGQKANARARLVPFAQGEPAGTV